MKHLSYIHFNFNKRHCTYADPRFIVKRLRCHLFLTNSDGYQLRWLPTELVINQFHNELITQHKILCIESIIFDSNKVSVINSFGDIEIGELHRRRKMFSAKLESANFVVGEKKIRRKCTNSSHSSSASIDEESVASFQNEPPLNQRNVEDQGRKYGEGRRVGRVNPPSF